jgi:regulatory protein
VRRKTLKLAESELFEYSVRYLGGRACSTEELKSKLRPRAAKASDVDAVLARLSEIGYLNDARFAESFATNRAENDGFGKMRVLSDLRGRRIAPEMAERTVAEVFADRNEADLIDSFIERRMPTLRTETLIEDQRELGKAYRRLRRAGFSPGGSLAALKRRAARPEEIEEPPEDEADEA